MIKLIGCLDKRLQGQQISSAAVATELSHQYFPVVECPCCGKKQMRCVIKSTSRQNKEVITGSGMTAVTVFPQYRFSCDSCSLKKYVLLTTDLEIDHSPFSMDSLFSIMLEKKVYHFSNRNLQDKYGMSRSAFMNWTQKFSHDYILLKTFLPDQATDEDILSDIRSMEEQGVQILSCGTCLNHYGLSEKLQVGTVTNMYEIVEKLSKAGRIIRP